MDLHKLEMVVLVKKYRDSWLADSKIKERGLTGCTRVSIGCIVSGCPVKVVEFHYGIVAYSVPEHHFGGGYTICHEVVEPLLR